MSLLCICMSGYQYVCIVYFYVCVVYVYVSVSIYLCYVCVCQCIQMLVYLYVSVSECLAKVGCKVLKIISLSEGGVGERGVIKDE